MSIETTTVGVQFDIAAIGTLEVAVGVAFGFEDTFETISPKVPSTLPPVSTQPTHNIVEVVHSSGYFDYAKGAGIAVGGSAGVEVGFWTTPVAELKGRYWGIEVELGKGVGGGVGFYFSSETGDFIGFQVVGGFGAEVDLRMVYDGRTYTFLESLPVEVAQAAAAAEQATSG